MIVAVTGMRAEAKAARRAGLAAVSGGGDAAATRSAIERAIREGATGLVSFGVAGGLAEDLPSGTVVLADAVLTAAGEALRPAVPRLRAPFLRTGAVYGADAIVADTAEKRAIHARSGALALDLESHLVGRAARAAGLPWAVIRAVADPASRSLPPAALVGLRPDGGADLGAVLRSLLATPSQLPALIRVARDTATALGGLRRVGLLLRVGGLGGVDAGHRLFDVA